MIIKHFRLFLSVFLVRSVALSSHFFSTVDNWGREGRVTRSSRDVGFATTCFAWSQNCCVAFNCRVLQEDPSLRIDRLRCSIEHMDLSKVDCIKVGSHSERSHSFSQWKCPAEPYSMSNVGFNMDVTVYA